MSHHQQQQGRMQSHFHNDGNCLCAQQSASWRVVCQERCEGQCKCANTRNTFAASRTSWHEIGSACCRTHLHVCTHTPLQRHRCKFAYVARCGRNYNSHGFCSVLTVCNHVHENQYICMVAGEYEHVEVAFGMGPTNLLPRP